MADVYKVKYIVIVEDENGEYIEHAIGNYNYWDTEAEALDFAKEMNEEFPEDEDGRIICKPPKTL